VAFVLLMEWVSYFVGSSPISPIHFSTILAYWRVDKWSDFLNLLLNKKSFASSLDLLINLETEFLVNSVISNWTGLLVFCCKIIARFEIWEPWQISLTFSLTRSLPRSLLSIAKLNNAKSRIFFVSSSLILIAQISLILSGGFWPINLPLFQGVRLTFVFSEFIAIPPELFSLSMEYYGL